MILERELTNSSKDLWRITLFLSLSLARVQQTCTALLSRSSTSSEDLQRYESLSQSRPQSLPLSLSLSLYLSIYLSIYLHIHIIRGSSGSTNSSHPRTGPSDAPLASNNFEAFLKVPEFLRPHTQIYCTSEWVLGNREDLAKDIIAELQPENGEEWWTYVCMGPSDPHPNWHLGMRGTQHRAVMWRVWKEGGTGFLYWGANCYEKATVGSAEIRFRRGLPPGDGVLFYPGEVFSSSHNPVASLRLE